VMRPSSLNILGKTYSITYVEKPSDVDIYKRTSLWGQVDYWTRSIRIFDGGRADEDLWHTLMHEVLHAIAEDLKLRLARSENHDEMDLLALALADFLFRNWLLRSTPRSVA